VPHDCMDAMHVCMGCGMRARVRQACARSLHVRLVPAAAAAPLAAPARETQVTRHHGAPEDLRAHVLSLFHNHLRTCVCPSPYCRIRHHHHRCAGPGAKQPMIFLKSGSSVAWSGALELPSWSSDVHHEVELAVQLGQSLEPVAAAVALDLTARDVQV
jgi:2-keto-4-pentenoate hydratase/2-oxohepta-3-ene-1,7-dioic acid hydratase in catechol pathway